MGALWICCIRFDMCYLLFDISSAVYFCDQKIFKRRNEEITEVTEGDALKFLS